MRLWRPYTKRPTPELWTNGIKRMAVEKWQQGETDRTRWKELHTGRGLE